MINQADGTTESTRRVDTLELFFDLVFVVIVKQLTDLLHGEAGPDDFLLVAGMLVLLWAAWLNVTTFANIAGIASADRRISVLASMAGIALIAVSIPEVTTAGAHLFAIGYAVARLAIWPLWVKTRRQRGLGALRPTIYGPVLAALWLSSIAVPDAARLWVWATLTLVEAALLLRGLTRAQFVPAHLTERVGLFTMIVLGESVVELILALSIEQSSTAWLVAGLGFTMICAFWWMYFQTGATVTERALQGGSLALLRDVLGAAHYLIILGLIGIAAGLGGAIEHANENHLPAGILVALCGGSAVYHAAHVVSGWRYGVSIPVVAGWAVFSVALATVVVTFGAGWAPWIVVAVMLTDALLHVIASPMMARRVAAQT
jgi:low temperature requirement protein LtrA